MKITKLQQFQLYHLQDVKKKMILKKAKVM